MPLLVGLSFLPELLVLQRVIGGEGEVFSAISAAHLSSKHPFLDGETCRDRWTFIPGTFCAQMHWLERRFYVNLSTGTGSILHSFSAFMTGLPILMNPMYRYNPSTLYCNPGEANSVIASSGRSRIPAPRARLQRLRTSLSVHR